MFRYPAQCPACEFQDRFDAVLRLFASNDCCHSVTSSGKHNTPDSESKVK
jgi:hypothetical protein